MKKQRLISLILCLVLCLAFVPAADAKDDFDVEAKAALLVDVNTGEILYEKDMHERNYPASITKVMTALLTLEAVDAGRLRLDQEITAQESAFLGLASDGSTAGIKPGETLTVKDLLGCLLVVSANESAQILAEAVSGSIPSFVALMNRRAEQLGCKDTHFVNPSGLHDDDHYTSAWDIYLIASAALKYKTFVDICGSKSYNVPETNLAKPRELHTTNYLISTWRTRGYYYEDARGIKTGSTPEAGYCLVATAIRTGRQLISVVLGAERATLEDGTVQTRSFSETIRLFDHGFDDFKSMRLIEPDEFICEVPVELSSEANYVVVHPAESLTRMVPSDLMPGDLTRTVELYDEVVDAPVAEGDELGTITISYDDVEYGTIPLIALNDVSMSKLLLRERQVKELVATTRFEVIVGGVGALIVGLVILRAVSVSRSRRYSRRRGGGGGYHYSGYRGRKKR